MTTHATSDAIEHAASAWVARRDRGPLTSEEEDSFQTWLCADPRHLGAYARAEAVLLIFDQAQAPSRLAEDTTKSARPAHSRRAFFGWTAAAAAIAATVAGITLLPQDAAAPGVRYASDVDGLRRVQLGDGSRLTLGPSTELTVRFGETSRHINLARGAAFFDVASDRRRPFEVVLGQVQVSALGTSFTVEDVAGKGGRVLVRHGSVAVRARGGARWRSARAGDRIVWNAGRIDSFDIARVDPEEMRRSLAWTEGMLAFEGETLAKAAAEFARYGDFRITFAEPALGQRKVSGWFSVADPRGFAHAAATSLGASAEDQENGVIIRPAP